MDPSLRWDDVIGMLGNNIWQKLAFDLLNRVFQLQFALFETLQLQEIYRLVRHQAVNNVVKILVLALQLNEFFT